MSLILSVYSIASFKEYILPSINNADYSITLSKDHFQLNQDVCLKLQVLSDVWSVCADRFYTIQKDGRNYVGRALKDKDILVLRTKKEEKISIIVKEVESIYHSFDKYMFDSDQTIRIGSDAGNDISYNYLKMVSKSHATITKNGSVCTIMNYSPNGTYVNSVKVEKQRTLSFGDYINIMGLHIIYLDNILAVDTSGKELVICDHLQPFVGEEKTFFLTKNPWAEVGKTIYHRAPRNYESLEERVIEIESPPEKARLKKTSLLASIGPSITMALPMLLGCMMMVYATQVQGGGSSLYMYSGLVMSLSSAIIGVLWGVLNTRNEKKEAREQEAYRFQAYSDYLVEQTEYIRTLYENTSRQLKEIYPDAQACIDSKVAGGNLWGRNHTHDDFLSHRLGLGNLPFQVKIEIPKKRFQLYKDDLLEKPAFIKENYETLYDVPVNVDLMEHKLIGIVGGEGQKGAIDVARILSTQLAANNCYTDVKLGYIYNKNEENQKKVWGFSKWLPHVWSEDKKTRFVASTKEEASEVFYELTRVFRARCEEKEKKDEIPKPYYVIFISDQSMLEGELFSKYIFEKDPRCGLTTILMVERYEELPNSCECIIKNDAEFQGMYDVHDRVADRKKITFDQVDADYLEDFSRMLAGFQVIEMEEGGEIPSSITFFDMLNIHNLEELKVEDRWAKNRTYDNIKGMVGHKAGGAPCYLDVHEKYHGPHGLVAGTTGSGKSETLQTYMLSLAVNYSPDDIGFFIIDYKGGGMANLFNGLPHMIGQISNLSGNQVKRAMISIKSENKRRQRVFNENGVNNINAYTKMYKNGEATLPVPHLFIIIDEFAELKREEPDFMKELISVAQVGRSLGVHLILATQKPSGTVDDNIWSNSKFRLCLRVQDRQDSNDMLHKPDAAYITLAGRCYLQVGNDEVYELFQSGYSGAAYDKDAGNQKTDIAKMISLNGKVEMTGNKAKASRKKRAQEVWLDQLAEYLQIGLKENQLTLEQILEANLLMNLVTDAMYQAMEAEGIDFAKTDYNTERLENFIHLYAETMEAASDGQDIPVRYRPAMAEDMLLRAMEEKRKLPEPKEISQLEAVKDYLAKVAVDHGYTYNLQLWMPVLPSHLYLYDFEGFTERKYAYGMWPEQENGWNLQALIGKVDDPENQAQMPLILDFVQSGHTAIIGSIVSGKSTMMQTMIYSLIQSYTPEWVNIYCLDFSSKLSAAFESAPHVGGIMYENDLDKVSKFFNMIDKILQERKSLFRGGNYSQYVQVNGVTLPAILIFIDNYASLKEKTDELYDEILIRLSKEGVNNGIYLIFSGNGFGMNDIPNRVGDNIGNILCLNLADKYAYADMLHTNQFDVMPEAEKGRGLALVEDRVLEYQTALAVEAENDYERMEKIKAECQNMAESYFGKVARKIPEIPKKPLWSIFQELEDFQSMVQSVEYLPIGYDAANASVYGIPLRQIYCYTIWGDARTGKSNLLKVCIQSALKKKANICIIDDDKKTLRTFASNPGLTYACDEDSIFSYFSSLLPEFVRRNKMKQQLLQEDKEEDEIFDIMSEEIPYFIFISDLAWFVPFIYHAEKDMKGFLENIIQKGRLHNIYFISDMGMDKREYAAGYAIYEYFIAHKAGIHLGGKTGDNPVLNFEYLPYMEQTKTEKIGIGQLPAVSSDQETEKVVIPHARK